MVQKNKKWLILFVGCFVLILISFPFIFKDKPKNEEIAIPVEPNVQEEVRVSFMGVGDNLIHETIYLDAETDDGRYDFSKFYKNFIDDLNEKDLSFINQETILGGTQLGLSGYPTFNSPTEIAKNLDDVGFDLVNLASNHSLDKYEKGIQNELEALEKTNLIYDGVYRSQEEYDTIPVFEKKGIKFSFLAYTYGTNGIEPPNSYNVSYFDEKQIRKDVAKAKEISDVVIVSAHWGDENTFEPNGFQKKYAQLFADCGVNVVIGTHPHTIQPVTWITGKDGNEMLCVYSLGNFIGGMLTTENAIGGEITFDFVQKETSIQIQNVKWTPTIIHFEGNQNNILDERYNYLTYKVKDYSDELAKKHVLNGYEGNVVSLDYIQSITEKVIDQQFLK